MNPAQSAASFSTTTTDRDRAAERPSSNGWGCRNAIQGMDVTQMEKGARSSERETLGTRQRSAERPAAPEAPAWGGRSCSVYAVGSI